MTFSYQPLLFNYQYYLIVTILVFFPDLSNKSHYNHIRCLPCVCMCVRWRKPMQMCERGLDARAQRIASGLLPVTSVLLMLLLELFIPRIKTLPSLDFLNVLKYVGLVEETQIVLHPTSPQIQEKKGSCTRTVSFIRIMEWDMGNLSHLDKNKHGSLTLNVLSEFLPWHQVLRS